MATPINSYNEAAKKEASLFERQEDALIDRRCFDLFHDEELSEMRDKEPAWGEYVAASCSRIEKAFRKYRYGSN
jgi:hypothetical protein